MNMNMTSRSNVCSIGGNAGKNVDVVVDCGGGDNDGKAGTILDAVEDAGNGDKYKIGVDAGNVVSDSVLGSGEGNNGRNGGKSEDFVEDVGGR